MAKASEKVNQEKWLESNLRIMIYGCLNRPLGTRSIINALFILRTIIIVGVYVLLIIGCVAHMKIVHKFDFLASSINVLQVLIYITLIVVIGYHDLRSEAIHNLISRIRNAFRFASNTGHFTMGEALRMDKRRSVAWIVLLISATMCWFVLAIARGDDPVPVWAPVNLKESPYYEINIIVQFIGQFTLAPLAGSFGQFYVSVLTLLKHQFDMISCSLEHTGPLAALKMRRRIRDGNERTSSEIASEDSIMNANGGGIKMSSQCECCTEDFKRFFREFEKRRFENALTPSEIRVYEEELHNSLRDCIIHHQNIVQLRGVIDDFFGPVIFMRFLSSSIILCFIIYTTSKFVAKEDFNPADMGFLSVVEYFLGAIIELFVLCYTADRLFHGSTVISDDAFEKLPWYGGCATKKLISTLKIFHLNARKPTCLRTTFYVLSIEIYIGILQASFSYYTVLRQLQSKLTDEKPQGIFNRVVK